jgi:hypothetical protein
MPRKNEISDGNGLIDPFLKIRAFGDPFFADSVRASLPCCGFTPKGLIAFVRFSPLSGDDVSCINP